MQLSWSAKRYWAEFCSIKCIYLTLRRKLIQGTQTGFFQALGNSEVFEYMEDHGPFLALFLWTSCGLTKETWWTSRKTNLRKFKGFANGQMQLNPCLSSVSTMIYCSWPSANLWRQGRFLWQTGSLDFSKIAKTTSNSIWERWLPDFARRPMRGGACVDTKTLRHNGG